MQSLSPNGPLQPHFGGYPRSGNISGNNSDYEKKGKFSQLSVFRNLLLELFFCFSFLCLFVCFVLFVLYRIGNNIIRNKKSNIDIIV